MKKVDKVVYSKTATKFIKSRTPKEKEKLQKIINDNLCEVPEKGDIKILKGFSDSRKRLRVDSYRIIYRYDENNDLFILNIIQIGNRGDVYKKKGR